MPNNADRRRKVFFRQVRAALNQVEAGDGHDQLDDVLRQVHRWVARPPHKGVDARIVWSTWTEGRHAQIEQGLLKPLPALLMSPAVPVATKTELVKLTRRIMALPQAEPVTGERIAPDVWLRSANVPAVVALVQDLGRAPVASSAYPDSKSQGWARALADLIVDPLTWSSPSGWTMTHRRELVQAAIASGWLREDVLDTTAARWPGAPEAWDKRSVNKVALPYTAATQPGSLVDLLAASETPGGLLEHWRDRHPHDWSTWVSPASGTTVWGSLLQNPNPALLAAWLRDDPSALDRAVPVGRWSSTVFPTLPDDSLGRHTIAGRTAGRGDLKAAYLDPGRQDLYDRLLAWWDDPAPTLRTTLEVWRLDLLPMNDSPHPHHEAWQRLGVTIERQDLLDTIEPGPPVESVRRSRRL